jgi:isocitrate dehydrogenase (NAD+)
MAGFLCAGLMVAPEANGGDNCAIFEAVHGSAPKYAGRKKVNPSAVLISGVMMLCWLNEKEAADRIEKAMDKILAEGEKVTYDVGGTANSARNGNGPPHRSSGATTARPASARLN